MKLFRFELYISIQLYYYKKSKFLDRLEQKQKVRSDSIALFSLALHLIIQLYQDLPLKMGCKNIPVLAKSGPFIDEAVKNDHEYASSQFYLYKNENNYRLEFLRCDIFYDHENKRCQEHFPNRLQPRDTV